jgi:oligoendopeptidase F
MKIDRNFIGNDFKIYSKEDILLYLEDLKNRRIHSKEELLEWWNHKSETEAFLEEDMAWRYIKTTCDTENKQLAEEFNFFVSEIQPVVAEYSDLFDKKLIQSEFLDDSVYAKYQIPLKKTKRSIELFRVENIPIFSELQKKEREFGEISGAMSIVLDGEEMTLQNAGNFLRDTNRDLRKEVFELIHNRRIIDSEKLDLLLNELIKKRHLAALNAGFDNYRDYMHSALNRFDYSIDDCFNFHNSIKEIVLPVINQIDAERKNKLGYPCLKPYDTVVDVNLKPSLKPFSTGEDLIEKAIEVLLRCEHNMEII